MERHSTLANHLKPLILKYKGASRRVVVSSGGGGGSDSTAHQLDDTNIHLGTLSWGRLNFTGASLSSIPARNHNLLGALTTSDDHTQYVHNTTARTITARHTFNPSSAASPFVLGANALAQLVTGLNAQYVGGQLESVFMRKSANSDLNMNGFRVTSNDGDTYHLLGKGFVGYAGASGSAMFGHRDYRNTTDYAFRQYSSNGATAVNSPAEIQFQIGGSFLERLSSTEHRLFSAVTLKSDNYASQTTGWGITYAGAADFRYLFTDELHAKVFIADLEQALAGGQIISKSVAVLSRDFTAPAPGAATTIYLEDLPSAENMAVFQSGDIIRVRQFSRASGSLSITNCWGVVTSYSNLADKEQSWTFTRSSSPNSGSMNGGTVIGAGAIILDYGTTGNGFYEVNAIDGLYAVNSPYMQIVTWSGHPNSGQAVRVRVGNLTGVGVSDYGIRMGTDVSSAATTTFDFRASTGATTLGPVGSGKPNLHFDGTDLNMRQNTTNVITLAGSGDSYFSGVMTIGTSGEIRQGTGTLGSNFTGLRMWRDTNVGRIGGYNSNTLQWWGDTDGKFYAGGGNVLLDADGLALASDTSEGGIQSRRIAWWRSVGTHTGEPVGSVDVWNDTVVYSSQTTSLKAHGSSTLTNANVRLLATNYAGSASAYWDVASNGSITTTGEFLLTAAAPTLGSNWAHRSGDNLSARYFANVVNIVGIIDGSSTPSTTLATVAAAYRPSKRRLTVAIRVRAGSSTAQRVDINTDGTITAPDWTPQNGDAILFELTYFL